MSLTPTDIRGKYRYRISLFRMMGSVEIVTDWIPNLVTNNGRTLILGRLQSNGSNFINAIAVGTGTNVPALNNTALQTETVRKAASASVNGTPAWNVVYSAQFTASEINNTTEIGLLNNSTSGGTLVTRSTHSAINIPAGSNMSVDYILGLVSSRVVTGWTLESGRTYTYKVNEAVVVKGVTEINTDNGYAKKASIAEVESAPCSYYHSGTVLYIRTSTGTNPSNHTIVVTSGG